MREAVSAGILARLERKSAKYDVPVGTLAGKDARAHGDKRSHSFAYRYNQSSLLFN